MFSFFKEQLPYIVKLSFMIKSNKVVWRYNLQIVVTMEILLKKNGIEKTENRDEFKKKKYR